MYCPECGNKNPDTAKFCIKCGHDYRHSAAEYTPVFASPAPSAKLPLKTSVKSKTTSGNYSALTLLAGLLLILLGGIFVYGYISRANENNLRTGSPQNFAASINQTQSLQQTVNIVNESFSVKAGQMVSYKFTIPKEAGKGIITGSFTASGGGNDIYVLVTNQTGLTNIKNGNQAKGYYESGKVTTDELNLNLAPGTYYIVFSNSQSLLTPKTVNANINLSF